jgi:hypothetical protein
MPKMRYACDLWSAALLSLSSFAFQFVVKIQLGPAFVTDHSLPPRQHCPVDQQF